MQASSLKLALVVPHIFMQQELLGQVIFSPAELAMSLAEGLSEAGVEVSLYTPGPVQLKPGSGVRNITADLSGFKAELEQRGDSYLDLLKKHPLTFISLARQVQAELIAQTFQAANNGEHDLVHIYINEEELGLVFAELCAKPVVFTHHDPFNFLVKYRSLMPRYKHLNWLALSEAQKQGMPAGANFIATIHHGLPTTSYQPNYQPRGDYLAYLGRIVEPKGVHLAIAAAKQAGKKLKIAGKHYAGHHKDKYWQNQVAPQIDGQQIEYLGFLDSISAKQEFLGNAQALIMPSTWNEPFGMVMLEALACATPVIGLANGAICEIIKPGVNGLLVENGPNLSASIHKLAQAMQQLEQIDRRNCRESFLTSFTLEKMVMQHLKAYQREIKKVSTNRPPAVKTIVAPGTVSR